VRLLLDQGTKVDTNNKEERTVLDVAVFKEHKTVMRVLRAKKKWEDMLPLRRRV